MAADGMDFRYERHIEIRRGGKGGAHAGETGTDDHKVMLHDPLARHRT
jgi:hypothetical protein